MLLNEKNKNKNDYNHFVSLNCNVWKIMVYNINLNSTF